MPIEVESFHGTLVVRSQIDGHHIYVRPDQVPELMVKLMDAIPGFLGVICPHCHEPFVFSPAANQRLLKGDRRHE